MNNEQLTEFLNSTEYPYRIDILPTYETAYVFDELVVLTKADWDRLILRLKERDLKKEELPA